MARYIASASRSPVSRIARSLRPARRASASRSRGSSELPPLFRTSSRASAIDACDLVFRCARADERVDQHGAGQGSLKPGATGVRDCDPFAGLGDRGLGVTARQTGVGEHREVVALPVERRSRAARLRQGLGEALLAGAAVAAQEKGDREVE